MRNLAIVIALLGLVLPAGAEEAGYRVIVHPDNPTTELSANLVSDLLLKKKTKWDHGAPVQPVDLAGDSPVRAAFSKAVHGRAVSSIKNYWQRIFTGRGVPPPELLDDEAVVSYVKSHKGAIGYVSAKARLDGVKEVALVN